MRTLRIAAVAVLVCASTLGAQQDSTTRAKARADSIAKAVRDSVALMKELGGALAPPTGAAAGNTPVGPQSGPTNPRLLPDFSAVGDLVGDLSPRGSTQADSTRFGVREVEIAVQAVVDPYFRGDVFLGASDLEGISIEQAFLTTTSLPNQFEVRIGRFLMPFGKENTTHRHDLHTIEYPWVIQRFLSNDGFKGTGLYGARVFSPFGFFQEVIVTAVDRLSPPIAGLMAIEAVNKSPAGLGYLARLRNYVDLSEAKNVELSFSALTGIREQPLTEQYALELLAQGVNLNATNVRQTTLGADLTYRWRPLQQGLYKSFILQSEVMYQINDKSPTVPIPGDCSATCPLAPVILGSYAGPARNYTGAYVFARLQTGQRRFIGSRYDYVQNPENLGRTLQAGSVYLEWFPSEFSKLVAAYEGVWNDGSTFLNRLLVQAVFSLGPHKPHPF